MRQIQAELNVVSCSVTTTRPKGVAGAHEDQLVSDGAATGAYLESPLQEHCFGTEGGADPVGEGAHVAGGTRPLSGRRLVTKNRVKQSS